MQLVKLLLLNLLFTGTVLGQQTITNVNLGSAPNAGDGDPARTAFNKLNVNDNFLNVQTAQKANTNSPTIFAPIVVGGVTADKVVSSSFIGNGAGITNVGTTATNAINNNNGFGTNATLRGTVVRGTSFGNDDVPFYLGSDQNNQPGIYNPYFGFLEIQGGAHGFQLVGPARDTILYLYNIDSQSRIVTGAWHQQPTGNFIPNAVTPIGGGGVNRNAGAAADIYANSLGGSGSGLVDLTARTSDIHLNQTKPYVILSTRLNDNSYVNNYYSCNANTVTGAITAFSTNGCLNVWTNVGIGVALDFDSGGWLTNHRDSVTGLLRVNTNNFPAETARDTMFTNTLNYFLANGIEPWLMCYGSSRVPNIQNWPAGAAFSELDVDQLTGNGVWEYPGGNNGTTGGILQPVVTTDSAHKDISTFYMWGARGFILQDTLDGSQNGSGYYDQLYRVICGAAVNPYAQPGQGNQIGLDAPWPRWYPGSHAMICGFLTGAALAKWAPKIQADMNQTWVESNEQVQTSGTGALSWLLGMIRYNQNFFTNLVLNDFPTMAGDGQGAPGWNYQNWYDYLSGQAVFNGNLFLARSFDYATNSYWGGLVTNRYWMNAWQDVRRPITCVSLNNSNSIWARTMTTGEKLVWFVNEAGTSTNLTVSWNNLGLVTNTSCLVVDLITNVALGTASSGFLWNTPAHSSMLVKITPVSVLFSGISTNAESSWLTGALSYGGFSIVNSNSLPLIQLSSQSSTNWVSTNILSGDFYVRVTGSDATTTGQSLVNVTGLSAPLGVNAVYEFEADLSANTTADTTGIEYGVNYSVSGGAVEAILTGAKTTSAVQNERINALNTATGAYLTTSAMNGGVLIKGIVTTGANAGNLTIQHLKVTSGTSTVRQQSYLRVKRIQ